MKKRITNGRGEHTHAEAYPEGKYVVIEVQDDDGKWAAIGLTSAQARRLASHLNEAASINGGGNR